MNPYIGIGLMVAISTFVAVLIVILGVVLGPRKPTDRKLAPYESGVQPVPKWLIAPPDKTATGNIAAMALYAGQSVSAVAKIQPAAEIVKELANAAETLLQKLR